MRTFIAIILSIPLGWITTAVFSVLLNLDHLSGTVGFLITILIVSVIYFVILNKLFKKKNNK